MGKTFSDIYNTSNTATIQTSDLMILQRSDGNTYAFAATSLQSFTAPTSESINSSGGSVTLDITKNIHKLAPTISGSNSYVLPNGTENQIIYLVPAKLPTNIFSNEATSLSIQNARWSKGLQIQEGTVATWLPFTNAIYNLTSGSCVITLIFTDGHWNLPHSYGTS